MRHTIILLISILPLMALVDLGKIGPVETIKEENIRELFQKKISSMKLQDVKKQLVASLNKRSVVTTSLSGCIKTTNKVFLNEISIKNDYKNIGGDYFLKKGEKQTLFYPIKVSLCVVNGMNIDFATRSLEELLKIGHCDKVLVANSDFRNLQSKFQKNKAMKFYPFHQELSDSMNVKCLPSRAEAYKTFITIDQIAIEALK